MLLHDLILRQAERSPDRPALVRGDDTTDYRGLAEDMTRVSSALAGLGVSPGDRVAVYLQKQTEAVLSFFGISRAGAAFVPINPSLKPQQVAHILQDSGAVALITTRARASALSGQLTRAGSLRWLITLDDPSPCRAETPSISHLAWSDLPEAQTALAEARRIDSDPAAIIYTSGSTGKPKGVVLSHRNLVAGAMSVAEYLDNRPDDVILAVLPFSFDAGFSQLSTAFASGASVALLDYLVPRDVLDAAGKHRVTGIAGIPSLWIQLARLEWPAEVAANLRYVTNTGGNMPTTTLDVLRRRLPGTRIFLMYGLTEAFRSTYLPPEELDRRPTSIGKAIPNADVHVVRPDGAPCAPGEPGELVHRGPLVALGYWNDPEQTRQRFRPFPNQPSGLPLPEIAVWSGDTVVSDEEGFLYFVGRRDEMIKSSGYRISPTEVEEAVYASGLVNECAALGIPHDELGQAIVVACQSDDPGEETLGKLLAACRAALPAYMVPSAIEFRDALPSTPNGKIDRRQLAGEYEHLFRETVAR